MYVQNAVRWSRFSAFEAWCGTLVLILLAFMVRTSLSPVLEPFGIFHFFILSCLAIQFFFGYRYAVAGLVISIFVGEFFFVEPFASFDVITAKDIIITLGFATVTLAAIVLMETLQRGSYSRALLLKVSNSRHWISLQRENDRLHYARKSSEAWSVLELLLQDFDRILLLQYDHAAPRLEPLFYQLTGWTPENARPDQWIEAFHPEDQALLLKHLTTDRPVRPGPTAPTLQLNLRLTNSATLESSCISVQIMRFVFMNKPLWILSQA